MTDRNEPDQSTIDELGEEIDDVRRQAIDHGNLPDPDPEPTFFDPTRDPDLEPVEEDKIDRQIAPPG